MDFAITAFFPLSIHKQIHKVLYINKCEDIDKAANF